MALAETAKLTVQLNLKDGLSKGLAGAVRNLRGFETSAGKIGNLAKSGLANAAASLAKIGAVAAVGIAALIKSGISDLAKLENAVTAVDGAITQMGLAGQVTGAQIATWANEIEAATQAAFDDKEIVAATATLIRFGKLAPQNIRPAMQIITDLAVKTGSVDSAATLLAKALADPTKAAGKLARQGVVLTKVEQDQIKAFMDAGNAAAAQQVILDSLARTTAGAATAAYGPYNDALNVLNDVSEDARKALAEGFLPVLQKVSAMLSTELAKPETMANIRQFGQGLATGLDKLIGIARNLPWGAIGTSLQIAGNAATAVVSAFASMPAWVQTAVITSWGLNKLSGGALGGIVAELGKGLIKGVLGMTAAVVNIKAGVVTGGGVPGTGGGGGGILPGAGAAAGAIASMGGTAAVASVAASLLPAAAMLAAPYIFQGKPGSGPTAMAIQGGQGTMSATTAGMMQGLIPGFTNLAAAAGTKPIPVTVAGWERDRAQQRSEQAQARAIQNQSLTTLRQGFAASFNEERTTAARLSTANARLSAIQRKRTTFKVTVPVRTTVSIRSIDGYKRYQTSTVKMNQLAVT